MSKKNIASALLAMLSLLAASSASAQTEATCPNALKDVARCYVGADANGAHYWIAIPREWNKTLVMHAHGGPRMSPITRDSSLEDLERFAVTVRQGFAWAGSSYRRPGYGVRMAAEDTENLRKIFIAAFGQPRRTLLHGQSWGGNVAAKGVELYGAESGGKPAYDGVVLTSGMVAGGTRNYLHRADLRAVYQYYCGNHPRPDEPQYPLWMGLPADSRMSGKQLEARVDECTGIKSPPERRSAEQKRRLDNILGVIPVPERTLVSHLNWATFLFHDLTQRVLEGGNPFDNRHVVYRGSDDDAALNKGVVRFDADPKAGEKLAHDSDMSGKLPVPAIALHAIDDPTAMVEYEAQYRSVVEAAGKGGSLVQVFTREREHSKLSDAEYAAVFGAMMRWIDKGEKPSAEQIAAGCTQAANSYSGGCHVDAAYVPASLFSRVAPR